LAGAIIVLAIGTLGVSMFTQNSWGTSLVLGLFLQTVTLTSYLVAFDRKTLFAIFRLWKPSMLAGFMGADQWRLLFAIGLLPALIVLLIRVWVPESPHWLARQGRMEEARNSLVWALQVRPETLPLPAGTPAKAPQASWFELFKYPRSLLVSWLGNAGAQTGAHSATP
jgi:MFS family permease